MNIFISEAVKILVDAMLADPDSWEQGAFEFVHKTKNIRIWTVNGVWFVEFTGNDCFNIFEKFYIMRGIKKATAMKVHLAIKEQLK